MVSVNRVMMAGGLTRDPEMRRTQSGMAVTKFGLALSEQFTGKDGEQRRETCFVDVEVWGKQGEACASYLRKGAPAFVEGKLQTQQWQDAQTGQRRQRLLVRAERVHFLGTPRQDAEHHAPGPDFEGAPVAPPPAAAGNGRGRPRPQPAGARQSA